MRSNNFRRRGSVASTLSGTPRVSNTYPIPDDRQNTAGLASWTTVVLSYIYIYIYFVPLALGPGGRGKGHARGENGRLAAAAHTRRERTEFATSNRVARRDATACRTRRGGVRWRVSKKKENNEKQTRCRGRLPATACIRRLRQRSEPR